MALETQTPETPGQLPIDVNNKDANGQSSLIPQKEAPKVVEGARQETKVTGTEAKTPAPEIYTEEELNQRLATVKGGHEGTVKQMREQLAAAKKAAQEARDLLDQQKEEAWLKSIEGNGGDVNVAKAIIDRDRAVRVAQAAQVAKEAELSEREAILNEAGRTKTVLDLMATYELPPTAKEKLLAAQTPEVMENLALKMHVEKLKGKGVQAENPDKGTGQKGVDISKLSIKQRMGMAMEGRL